MFKRIHDRIDMIIEIVGKINRDIDYLFRDINTHIKVVRDNVVRIPEVEFMQKTIDSQQRTIEQLTNALKDKYDHGLFIFSEDGKIPMVIRNGKELTNELTSYFGIDWNVGEIPTINIEQRAVTYHDMEV